VNFFQDFSQINVRHLINEHASMPYLLPILTDEGELFYVISGVAHGLYFVLSGLLKQISGYYVHLFKEIK
jgi:hypothetical protein